MFDIANIGLISPNESIYHQRCKDIQKKKKKYDIHSSVFKHNFNDKEYYVLQVDLKHKNSHLSIADALHIKKDDVHFIHISLNEEYKIYWVSEDLLNARYLDGDGRLNFETIEDNAIKLIRDDNTVCTNIWNNPEDIIIKLIKKS